MKIIAFWDISPSSLVEEYRRFRSATASIIRAMMMNWRGCGNKRLWPNLRYCPGNRLEVLRKNPKNLSQDNRSSGQDFNPGHPDKESLDNVVR
jgi:hypothetical protein